MILRTHTKQPRDEKDYDVDYAPWLVGEDSLDEVTTTITCLTDPSDTPLVSAADPPMTATRAKFWISGVRAGQINKLTMLVPTVENSPAEYERHTTLTTPSLSNDLPVVLHEMWAPQ